MEAMAPRRVLTLAALLTCAAALGACGSGSGSTSSGATTSAGAPAGSAGASQTPLIQIKLANIAFSPSAVNARVGQRITWVNEDSVDHNVIARSGASFRSAVLHSGDSYSFTPTRAGRILYVCTIHPNMTATLTVVR